MVLPKLTQTIFMKEVKCARCGFSNLWVTETEQGPFYCSQLCLQRASSLGVSSEEVNQVLEQRVGEEPV